MITKNTILLCFLIMPMTTVPFSFFNLTSPDVAIDLGTQNTDVSVCLQDGTIKIIANVPSVVALDTRTNEVLAVGQEAKRMLGKTPAYIRAERPMRDGVIKDFEIAEKMLRYIFKKATDYQAGLIRGPRMIIGVPCNVTDSDVRAIKEIAYKTGAREVHAIMEPMAAAIGANLPIDKPIGSMVVDMGGGTTDIVVISLKAPVVSHAIRIAGDEMDRSIVKHVHDTYQLRIGDQTAESIKKEIGTVWLEEGSQGKSINVGGSDIISGLPRTITLTGADMMVATNECMIKVLTAMREVLNETPTELVTDITKNGLLLVGGGALMGDIAKRIEQDLGVTVHIPKSPLLAVINGIAKVMVNFNYYKESLFDKKLQLIGAVKS